MFMHLRVEGIGLGGDDDRQRAVQRSAVEIALR